MGIGMGKFDEVEHYLCRYGTAGFELKPGAKWEAEALGQERPAILSKHLLTDQTDSEGQVEALVLPHDRPYPAVWGP
jgi:hypothetical protein